MPRSLQASGSTHGQPQCTLHKEASERTRRIYAGDHREIKILRSIGLRRSGSAGAAARSSHRMVLDRLREAYGILRFSAFVRERMKGAVLFLLGREMMSQVAPLPPRVQL